MWESEKIEREFMTGVFVKRPGIQILRRERVMKTPQKDVRRQGRRGELVPWVQSGMLGENALSGYPTPARGSRSTMGRTGQVQERQAAIQAHMKHVPP